MYKPLNIVSANNALVWFYFWKWKRKFDENELIVLLSIWSTHFAYSVIVQLLWHEQRFG